MKTTTKTAGLKVKSAMERAAACSPRTATARGPAECPVRDIRPAAWPAPTTSARLKVRTPASRPVASAAPQPQAPVSRFAPPASRPAASLRLQPQAPPVSRFAPGVQGRCGPPACANHNARLEVTSAIKAGGVGPATATGRSQGHVRHQGRRRGARNRNRAVSRSRPPSRPAAWGPATATVVVSRSPPPSRPAASRSIATVVVSRSPPPSAGGVAVGSQPRRSQGHDRAQSGVHRDSRRTTTTRALSIS